jgi:hypothetical protein
MAEVLSFEVNFGAAQISGQPPGKIKGGCPPSILAEILSQLSTKGSIPPGRSVGTLQLGKRRHESFGYIPSPIDAEVTLSIRLL